MQTQTKICGLLNRRANEILEIEAKYYELLKHEYLVRSVEIKKIPNFWVKCIQNHHTLPTIINSKDWEIFSYISDLTVDEYTSRQKVKTYKLTLDFEKNPYFNNNSLWIAVNNDEQQSLSASGVEFKGNYSLKEFHDTRQSFFSIFFGVYDGSVLTDPGFVFDIVDGIRIDLWEDPFKYYEISNQ